MATDLLYYGGVIPDHFKEVWYANIKKYIDINKDNMMARRLAIVKPVPYVTEEYSITAIDVSAEEVVPKARSAAPENITLGGNERTYRIFRYPTGFVLNEDDLKKQPELQGWHIDACTRKIFRAEDKSFYVGRSNLDIIGFKAAAEANSNGKIVASGASGKDNNNNGAWLTDDGSRDIYEDLRMARGKLASKYRSNLQNLFLVGNAVSMDALWQKDPYSDDSSPILSSVAPLFGRSSDAPIGDWALINDQIDDNYVFIVCRDSEAAELIEAKALIIDDNYPRQPIGNLQVAIYEDVGIAIHDYNAFVEIAVN